MPSVRPLIRLILLVLVPVILLTVAGTAIAHPGSGIALDRAGSVYFVDSGSGLWKIDTAGRVSKLHGPAYHWMALDPANGLAKTRLPRERSTDMVAAGANPTALLASDYPIVVGHDGNLYYPLYEADKPLRLMKMTPAGVATLVGEIPASKSGPLRWINGLAVGPDGMLYYTEDDTVWRMTSKGQASVVATVSVPSGATLTPGHTDAMGPMLRGLAIDSKGVIYAAAAADGRVVKITRDGKIETVLQTQSPWAPTAVATHGADVYVLEYQHTPGDDRRQWLPRVRKVTPDGKSTIIATIEQMTGAR